MLDAWCCSVLHSGLFAQETPKKTYDDPAEVDADYAIQGEYLGEFEADSGKKKMGVQVIARGSGKFDAVGIAADYPVIGSVAKRHSVRVLK